LGGVAIALLALVVNVAASPEQEDPPQDPSTSDELAVDIDIDVSIANHQQVGETLDDLEDLVGSQLDEFDEAETDLEDALSDLADVDLAIVDLELMIEELTAESDQVVTTAYINPPSAGAVDLLTTETVSDLALKQALLSLLADHDGDVLGALAEAQDDLDDQLDEQEEVQEVAAAAHSDSAQALEDLENAMSQEAQFVLSVYGALEAGEGAEIDPEYADEAAALTDRLSQIEEATAAEREQRQIEERAREQAADGGFVCPVQPVEAVNFTDTWGAARSGGRTHQGTDMFAANGTATAAPVSGRVEHRDTSLGGMSWYVYGDNGDRYYGTHLSGYENSGVGWVEAGTTIGYVGSSGNASATAPHLHFEHHPGGGAAINPYPVLDAACGDH
jgi:murein DD-endopeptidase MepM/ murein hydrolase activator NlpD